MVPETRFTRVGDCRVAYQVLGNGPKDLLWVGGWNSHVDAQWELPNQPTNLRRLASFSRLILFDRRGMGASDPLPSGTGVTWEEWMDDIGAVLDAVGSTHPVVVGLLDGGPLAMLFAATHPARCHALVVVNSFAKFTWAEDYPLGVRPDALEAMMEMVENSWGSGALRDVAPSLADDREFWRGYDRFQRMASSRRAAVDQLRTASRIDVRPFLATIAVPTLVVHREHASLIEIEHGRYIGEHIAGARLVVVPGRDISQASPEMSSVVDAIEEFVTGVRPAPVGDRVLATVLFTDIVDSTGRAAVLGDLRWRALLDEYEGFARTQIAEGRGRLIKTTGDGVLAIFDGPARAIRCAVALTDRVRTLGIDTRSGLHTGEVEDRGDDVGGIGVHIASRVMSAAAPGEVVVSSTVRDLVTGSEIRFDDRGSRSLRGVPGKWRLFTVRS
jgi:class 3 adenylate cyclase